MTEARAVPSLGGLAWPDLAEDAAGRRPLLLVPVGSTEQHGPALPLTTDTLIASTVVQEAARHLSAAGHRVVVGPPVAYGASGEHQDFPGTVSIGHEALGLLLLELGRSACRWAEGLILVNGHGGNAPTVRDTVLRLRGEQRAVAWTDCHVPGADAHAGRAETSLVHCLAPATVVVERLAPGATAPMSDLMPRLRSSGVRAVSANGVLGDPTGAGAEEGQRLLGVVVARVVTEISDIDVGEDGRLRLPERSGARV